MRTTESRRKRRLTAGACAALAAAAIFGGSRLLRTRQALAQAEQGVTMPVLMYHAIMDSQKRAGDYVITPDALREDLRYIKGAGYTTIVMSDVIAYVQDGAPLPEKPILLTFDDGYYNNYLYLFPMLQEYGMRAVISPIAIETEKFSAAEDNNEFYSHLTWDMINEMKDSGLVEFQNHSYNLHKLGARKGAGKKKGESTEAYQAVIREDLSHAQRLFQENTGWTPNTFTYPFGAYSSDTAAVLGELGFSASLGVEQRLFHLTRDPACLVRIPRYNRPWGRTAKQILEKAMPCG